MPCRPILALFLLVAIFLSGCGGGVSENEPSTVDGKLLATCGIESEAYIWRLADGRCVQTNKETEFDSIRNVAWSPNGKFLGLVCEGTVRVFGPADASENG